MDVYALIASKRIRWGTEHGGRKPTVALTSAAAQHLGLVLDATRDDGRSNAAAILDVACELAKGGNTVAARFLRESEERRDREVLLVELVTGGCGGFHTAYEAGSTAQV